MLRARVKPAKRNAFSIRVSRVILAIRNAFSIRVSRRNAIRVRVSPVILAIRSAVSIRVPIPVPIPVRGIRVAAPVVILCTLFAGVRHNRGTLASAGDC